MVSGRHADWLISSRVASGSGATLVICTLCGVRDTWTGEKRLYASATNSQPELENNIDTQLVKLTEGVLRPINCHIL